ncbi:MAG: HEAT repeat domain-containing protein [Planctomycetes bacterium]|nr:HEAT repeat domain-containing protein [Planctomycetota bacterium]
MLDCTNHPASSTLLRRALILACVALGAVPLRGQDPDTTSIEVDPTPSSRARTAPKDSIVWLRAQNMAQLTAMMADHPLHFAWMSAAEVEAPLTRSLRDLAGTVRDLAVRQGLEKRLFDALWGKEVELSVHPTKTGHAFLLMLDAGEHESLVQDFVDRLETVDRASTTRRISHPFGDTGEAFVGFAGTKLLISNDRATLQNTIDRAVRNADPGSEADASSLAADPTFVAASIDSDRRAWFQVFVRGTQTWVYDTLQSCGVLPRFAANIVRKRTQAIAFELRNESGFLATSVRFVGDGNPVLPFLTNKRPDPRLARMIPADQMQWVAIGYEPSLMLDMLLESGTAFDGLGLMEVLDKDITAVLPGKSAKNIAASLAPSLLSLTADSTHPDLEGTVLLIEDNTVLREILAAIGTERQKPGSSDRAIHRYSIERAGKRVFATLIDDMLLLAATEASESAMLERALSGEADAAIAQRFAANDGRYWLIGNENARVRLDRVDPRDEDRLYASAQHFDIAQLRGELDTDAFLINGRGATGLSHLTALFLARTIPAFLDSLYAERQQFVLECANEVLDATRRFTSEAKLDRDRDGKGEPEGISQLRNAGLFSSKLLTESKGEIIEARGYRLTLVFPSELDTQEEDWGVLAWPAQPGISGDRSWFARKDGKVYIATRLPELDPGSGPTTKQLFGEVVWSEKPTDDWTWANPPREVAAIDTNEQPVAGTTDKPATDSNPGTDTTPRAEPTEPTEPTSAVETEPVARAEDPDKGTETTRTESTRTEPTIVDRVRADQARTLEVAGTNKKIDELSAFLSHEVDEFRARAAWYLGQIASQDSIPRLARVLHDDSSIQARRAAAQALSKMRNPKSRASLVRALTDEDAKVRLLAATGLLGSKDKATTKALVDLVLAFPGDTAGDRTQAILAIADSGDATHLEAFTTVVSKTQSSTEAFVYCFHELSPKLDAADESKILIQALESPIRELREYSIRRIAAARHENAISVLEARLSKEDASLRPLLETAIASFGTKEKTDWVALAKEKASELYTKVRELPEAAQYGIAGAPIVLLLLVIVTRSRRRKARKNASIDHLVGPSSDTGPTPSLRSSTPREHATNGR